MTITVLTVSNELAGLETTVRSLLDHGPGYYFSILVTLAFVSAVVCVLVAVRYSDNPRVRKSFIAIFLSGLLIVNLAPFPSLLPFTHLHKYTETSSNPTGYYEIYVVDEGGNELRYDGEAARPAGTLIRFGRGIATEYREPKAKATAAHLLDRAIAHRQRIADGRGIGHHLDFPPHALGDRWNEATLAQYDEFVGVRIYYVELRYTDSGLDIEAQDRTLVANLTKQGELVRDGGAG